MKRKIAFLLAGILAAGSLLGGCGKKDSSAEGGESADGEVTLSFFDKNSGSNTFDDDVAKAIMEKTGVKINVEKSYRRSFGKTESDVDRTELSGYCSDG